MSNAARLVHNVAMAGAFRSGRPRRDHGDLARLERRPAAMFHVEPTAEATGERCRCCGAPLVWVQAVPDRALRRGPHDSSGRTYVHRALESACGHVARFARLTIDEARRR